MSRQSSWNRVSCVVAVLSSFCFLSSIGILCEAKLVKAAVQDDPQPLLPDLFPWVSESRGYLYDWVIEGDLLRFTTAFANSGVGHLELRGGSVLPNGNQQVLQRIFYDDGTFQDRLAGEFTYHQGHGHIHFDGYAIYSLRRYLPGGGVGELVATGGKISFCLIDITRYHTNAGASRYNSCGQIQGVTAGWSDVYTRSLPDQYINISLVPDGQYWLEVTIDPDNLLLESDTTNNSAMIMVEINRGGTSGGDRWEPNNSFTQATDFGRVSNFHEVGLSIHDGLDGDYFRMVSEMHGEFDVHLNFTHELGNLDLFVYDHQHNLVASSTSETDNEEVHFHGHEDHVYYIVVRGVDGASNGYELNMHGPGPSVMLVENSSHVPVQIPDGAGANSPGQWAVSTLLGPEVEITDLNLIFNRLDHTWLGDLEIELISPQGTVAKILTSQWQSGGGLLGSQDNFVNTRLSDQAALNLSQGSQPYTGWFRINHANTGSHPLSVFNGENAYGVWTVRIRDWYSADTGTLRAWSLMFTGIDLNPGDRFEPNNSHPQAVDLGTLGFAAIEDVNIHNATDTDFYRFIAGVSGQANIGIAFSNEAGNLDMIVYDSDLLEVGRADSTSDDEWLELWVDGDELYYIEVFGVQGARNDYTLTVDVAPQIGETGTVANVSDQWQWVQFDRPFENPVVVAGPATFNDVQPGVVQIRNVNQSGFEIRMGNWTLRDNSRDGEIVDFLVVEEGLHELPGGQWLEAGVELAVDHRPVTVPLSFQLQSKPVILTQNAGDARNRVANTRLTNLQQDGFEVRLQEAEFASNRTAAQPVHWIAVSAGSDNQNSFKYITGFTKVSSFPKTISFDSDDYEMPRLFAGTMSYVESDPISIRLLDLKAGKATVFLQEDQTADKEITHADEIVGWISTIGRKIFQAGRSGD